MITTSPLTYDPSHLHTVIGPRPQAMAHFKVHGIALWIRANGSATLFFTEDGKRRQKTWKVARPQSPWFCEMGDWELICETMGHSGARRDALTDTQRWEVYLLADGFGKLTEGQIRELGIGWDWSHVRDSTAAAQIVMAGTIRGMLREPIAA